MLRKEFRQPRLDPCLRVWMAQARVVLPEVLDDFLIEQFPAAFHAHKTTA